MDSMQNPQGCGTIRGNWQPIRRHDSRRHRFHCNRSRPRLGLKELREEVCILNAVRFSRLFRAACQPERATFPLACLLYGLCFLRCSAGPVVGPGTTATSQGKSDMTQGNRDLLVPVRLSCQGFGRLAVCKTPATDAWQLHGNCRRLCPL